MKLTTLLPSRHSPRIVHISFLTHPIAIMSHVQVESGRITFSTAHRIRSLPGLPGPDYILEQSLVASTHSVGTAIRDSLDDMDQGCLITNVHRHTDKQAHMANAQRADPEEKQEVVCLKILSKDVNLTRHTTNPGEASY